MQIGDPLTPKWRAICYPFRIATLKTIVIKLLSCLDVVMGSHDEEDAVDQGVLCKCNKTTLI